MGFQFFTLSKHKIFNHLNFIFIFIFFDIFIENIRNIHLRHNDIAFAKKKCLEENHLTEDIFKMEERKAKSVFSKMMAFMKMKYKLQRTIRMPMRICIINVYIVHTGTHAPIYVIRHFSNYCHSGWAPNVGIFWT